MTEYKLVVALGECMLELQGQPFGTLQQGYGGDTLNAAVYLARCNPALRVAYATALGDDPLSDGLLQRWQAEGLRTPLVRRLLGRLPGLYMIEVDPQGERRFHYWRGQSAARDYFDTPPGETPLEREIGSVAALHFSGISIAILPPAGRERLAAVATALRERGATVVFDNNYRPRLWTDAAQARETMARFTALASIALLTLDDEMALWAETDEQRALQRCMHLPSPEVVVKRGARATLLRMQGSAAVEVETERVERVVDTTAAGDSFAGGYLAARLAGATAQQAASAGNRLAARVVQHRGAVIPREAMADLMPAP